MLIFTRNSRQRIYLRTKSGQDLLTILISPIIGYKVRLNFIPHLGQTPIKPLSMASGDKISIDPLHLSINRYFGEMPEQPAEESPILMEVRGINKGQVRFGVAAPAEIEIHREPQIKFCCGKIMIKFPTPDYAAVSLWACPYCSKVFVLLHLSEDQYQRINVPSLNFGQLAEIWGIKPREKNRTVIKQIISSAYNINRRWARILPKLKPFVPEIKC